MLGRVGNVRGGLPHDSYPGPYSHLDTNPYTTSLSYYHTCAYFNSLTYYSSFPHVPANGNNCANPNTNYGANGNNCANADAYHRANGNAIPDNYSYSYSHTDYNLDPHTRADGTTPPPSLLVFRLDGVDYLTDGLFTAIPDFCPYEHVHGPPIEPVLPGPSISEHLGDCGYGPPNFYTIPDPR